MFKLSHLIVFLALLVSCTDTKKEKTLSLDSKTIIEQYPELLSISYSIEDHLEINLFTSKLNLLTEDEKKYLSRKYEPLVRNLKLDSLKRDIQSFILTSDASLSSFYLNLNYTYAVLDSLLANVDTTLIDKEKLHQKYQNIAPFRDYDELAIQYVNRLDYYREGIDLWDVDNSFDDLPDTAKQIVYSKLHEKNMQILLNKYNHELPDFNTFVTTGGFIKGMNQDIEKSRKEFYLFKFEMLSRTESRKNINLAHDALRKKYDLNIEEDKFLEEKLNIGINRFQAPGKDFSNRNKFKAGTGEDLLSKVAKKHEGKVILINLWATWCKPCLKEMPYAKQIKKHYQNKEVVFVYLCGGNCRKDKMQEKINKFGIIGDHYIVTNKETEDLFRIFGRRGFPNYRLLDKYGVLASDNILRPSSLHRMKISLDQLLEMK